MIDRRRFIELIGASALVPALSPTAQAQTQTYPSRFVRLIVPFPPGGGTDAIARVVSSKLSAIWGQQMVVENKGGGATSIGTDTVAKADPDGYTVLLQSMPLAVNKYLFATLPFDPVADLAPVTLICDYPNVMAVPMSSPARSVQEFIAYAKANPGKANYASSGHGTSVHLSGELFNKMTGLKLQHIPYRGAGPALNDLIPGRVDVMFNNIGAVMPLIQGGQLRALGVTSAKRARERAAGCADRVRGRRSRLRRLGLVRAVRAGPDAGCGHQQAARRRGRGARRPGDQGAARAARRRRDRIVAGGAAHLSQGRDGQMGRHHQGSRNQGRMT